MQIRLGLPGIVGVGLALSMPCAAQVFKAPIPQEVSQLEQLVGTWEGSGTMRMKPDDPPEKWTGECKGQWVLGKHFVQQDILCRSTGSGSPSRLHSTRLLYGWDDEHRSYVALMIPQEGQGGIANGQWTSGNSAVFACAHMEQGTPVLSRWTLTSDSPERHTLRVEKTFGTEAAFTCFEGSFERHPVSSSGTDGAFYQESREASYARGPSDMEPMQDLVGKWSVSGKLSPDPEKAMVEVVGTQTFEPLFSGTILVGDMIVNVEGKPDDVLQEASFLLWNPESRCYDFLVATSCGHVARAICAPIDDQQVVFSSSGTLRHKPFAEQVLLSKHAKDGQVDHVDLESHVLYAAQPPVRWELAFVRKR